LLPIESTSHRGLRASVCNGLLRLAGPILPGQVVVDSFGGTGNIPIECGVRFPAVAVFSCDADEEAISLSVPRIEHASASLAPGSTVSSLVADARCLPFGDASVDHFVCDLPFGNHTAGTAGGDLRSNTGGLLPDVLREVARCLKPGGRCVWLLLRTHARQVAVILGQASMHVLGVQEVRPVVVAGWPCAAMIMTRHPGELAPWEEGGARTPQDLNGGALHTACTVSAPLTDALQMMFPFHLTSQAHSPLTISITTIYGQI
jgi:ubiquinone/menaquinone biosynthesis C-methylase UbiE